MNQTVRFVKSCGKFDISVIFGALQYRTVLAINMVNTRALTFKNFPAGGGKSTGGGGKSTGGGGTSSGRGAQAQFCPIYYVPFIMALHGKYTRAHL
jgi:hypothetical protein